jgi:hypothetical protein
VDIVKKTEIAPPKQTAEPASSPSLVTKLDQPAIDARPLKSLQHWI